MLDWILISLGLLIVLPVLAFLCMKLGTVGFFKGREVFNRQSEISDSDDNETES